MTSRTSWARAAVKRSSSVSAHISSPLELWTMMLRICSPISVPPGSRVRDDIAVRLSESARRAGQSGWTCRCLRSLRRR